MKVSNVGFKAGWIMGALVVAFLLLDAIGKLLRLQPVVETTGKLGYPEDLVLGIGIIELVCVAVYLVPRTALLGALFLTGYLGGAVATHLRNGSPLFSHVLFPIYVALLIWGALFLRDARVRALLPFRDQITN